MKKGTLDNKICEAIAKAVKYLESSIQALTNENEKAFVIDLWFASAETEFMLFLFSLVCLNELSSPSWKNRYTSGTSFEPRIILTHAQNLLQKAKTNVESQNLVKAYGDAMAARSLLLKLSELFDQRGKV